MCWKAILGASPSARLMHQADACDMALRRPATIQRALVDGLFVCVEAELDHTKWYRTTDKDIAATIYTGFSQVFRMLKCVTYRHSLVWPPQNR